MRIFHTNSIKEVLSIINDITSFCKKCELEITQPAYDNMAYINWYNKPNTLMYMITNTEQFSDSNGIFSFIYDDNDEIIASCGAYRSEFDTNIVIGGVRSWKLPNFRGLPDIANKIMPYHLEWATTNGAKVFALTFNEYNEKMMRVLHRSGKYNGKQFLKFGQPPSDFYPNLEILPFKVLVKNTPQYILYKHIDTSYEPNWPRINE